MKLSFQDMWTPAVFEVLLFFRILSVITTEYKCSNFKVTLSYTAGTRIGLFVQHIAEVQKMLFKRSGIIGVLSAIALYIYCGMTRTKPVL